MASTRPVQRLLQILDGHQLNGIAVLLRQRLGQSAQVLLKGGLELLHDLLENTEELGVSWGKLLPEFSQNLSKNRVQWIFAICLIIGMDCPGVLFFTSPFGSGDSNSATVLKASAQVRFQKMHIRYGPVPGPRGSSQ